MTLYEAKELLGATHGWSDLTNPVMRRVGDRLVRIPTEQVLAEEIAEEKRIAVSTDETAMWICGDYEPFPTCKVCGLAAENLCDFEVSPGKTCDVPICERCAIQIGPDAHLCPSHSAGVVDLRRERIKRMEDI
jgi:hypothetical protein